LVAAAHLHYNRVFTVHLERIRTIISYIISCGYGSVVYTWCIKDGLCLGFLGS